MQNQSIAASAPTSLSLILSLVLNKHSWLSIHLAIVFSNLLATGSWKYLWNQPVTIFEYVIWYILVYHDDINIFF